MNTAMKAIYLLTLLVPLLFQSCDLATKPNQGACSNGFIDVSQNLLTKNKALVYRPFVYPFPNNTDVYYFYDGTKVSFIQNYELTDICCKEHLTVNFWCSADVTSSSVPITMSGEIFWNPGFPSVKASKIVPPGDIVTFDLEAGLYQKFKDKPGSADLSLTIEFESRGSIDLDIAFLKDRIKQLNIRTKASRWAP